MIMITNLFRSENFHSIIPEQLNDERNYYLEEKERFCEEMSRYKKKIQNIKIINCH